MDFLLQITSRNVHANIYHTYLPTKYPGDIFVLVLGIRHLGSSSPIYAIFKSVNYTMLIAAQLLPPGRRARTSVRSHFAELFKRSFRTGNSIWVLQSSRCQNDTGGDAHV